MDDNSIYYYLIFVVIALLSRVFGKKKVEDVPTNEGSPKERPLTFEELIEEFTRQASGKTKKEEIIQNEEIPEIIEVEKKNNQRSTYKDDEIQEIYNKSVYEAQKLKHTNTDNSDYSFFKEYKKEKEENEFANEIRNMISSPDSAAKAIILSEIINRKYT